jgi:hypothetical protein
MIPIYNPQNGIFSLALSKTIKGKEEERSIIQRLSLHAQTMRFYHPVYRGSRRYSVSISQRFSKGN